MATPYADVMHPYLLSASPDVTGELDDFIQASRNFRWNRFRSPTAHTPGTSITSLPPTVMGLPLAVSVSFIFDPNTTYGRDICDLHRATKFINHKTSVRKGCTSLEIIKPSFKSDLAGGPAFVLRFWFFFNFVFDIATEFLANAFITGEFYPSATHDQAILILTLMASDIPRFQSFYKAYTTGPLFNYMVFQDSQVVEEADWNFTREGIATSHKASYVATELANFLMLREKGVYAYCDSVAAKEVLTHPTCHFTPKNLGNPWTLCGAISDFATSVLDYITPLSDDPTNKYEGHRIEYYQSETLISVTHALLDDFGQLPVAHALFRTFDKTELPPSILAFAAAVVQQHFRKLRDLPLTGGREFVDEEAFYSEEFLECWGLHKDNIIGIMGQFLPDPSPLDSNAPAAENTQSTLTPLLNVIQSLSSPGTPRTNGKAILRAVIKAIESDARLSTVFSSAPAALHATRFLEHVMQNE